jgi:uncharacterized protein YpmB
MLCSLHTRYETVAKMKKRIFYSVLFILIVCLAGSFFVLWKANKPEHDLREKAEELALETKTLAVIDDSYAYNGSKPYITVIGKDEYGKQKAIFVPITMKEDAMQEIYLDEGISEEQAIQTVAKQANIKEIFYTKLGYEEAGPVWEITYKNEQDKINYVYILFEDGLWWKRILNL